MVASVRILLLFVVVCTSLQASEAVDFANPGNNRGRTFLLTVPKSGTNLMTGCLTVMTRRPISWFYWGSEIMDPASPNRNNISYNRLGLPLVSDVPLLYRTHYEFKELMVVPSEHNKLILLARNPKELLYRKFYLQAGASEDPDPQFIHEFMSRYLQAFEVYDLWCSDTRMMIFYEDFIESIDETLLRVLQFMGEPAVYYDDFLEHREAYLTQLLQSYVNQHTHNSGGASSRGGPKPIYYTEHADPAVLAYIDDYIRDYSTGIWERYLKRFAGAAESCIDQPD